jgi:gliding motility-associated-like protein
MIIFIPNAFTPDGDGINEVFKPSGTGYDLKGYEMSIYDRWGKNVFTSNSFDYGWDGKIEGTKSNINAVFVYQIRIQDLRGYKKEFVGQVTILGSNKMGD